jgi:CBS domain containing-hemolysin-like protein
MAPTAHELRLLRRGILDLCIIVAFLVIVATVFHYHSEDGWSYGSSIYFMVVSLLGIGFGDLVPKSSAMKLFTAVFR